MSNKAIQISNLYKSFGNNHVIKNISLTVDKGASFTLIGKSGGGKSVLIKNILGIIKPDSGVIQVNDINMTEVKQKDRIKVNKKIGLGMLFQGSALFDSLNIRDNIVFGIHIHSRLSNDEADYIALKHLKMVGLGENILKQYPSEISGGMQRRVALARLVAMKPQLIFFDEPTTGLDPIMSDVINNLIIDIRGYLNATSFSITHDMQSVRKISTHIAMIEGGEIIWQGDPSNIDNSGNELVDKFVRGYS